mmetsp:Transcript_41696/g.91533  ORF Transcript_41696/g.91533 Transcript_41696/m.91533 type:complete len:244 (+) Transcript_41696:443-1174(+)
MYAAMAPRRLASPIPSIRTARRPALAALPMATVATGTPFGICTIDRRESLPESVDVLTGTPMTGSGVIAAAMPGRWAAPPAPAMMTRSPRCSALVAYWYSRCGVRCAETMVSSKGTPKCSRISAAARIVGKSESEPMITPTSGVAPVVLVEPSSSTRSADLASATDDAQTLMWPILRLAFGGALPYQCTLARGMAMARAMGAMVVESSPSPITLSIATASTFIEGSPSGMPSTARRCISCCSV